MERAHCRYAIRPSRLVAGPTHPALGRRSYSDFEHVGLLALQHRKLLLASGRIGGRYGGSLVAPHLPTRDLRNRARRPFRSRRTNNRALSIILILVAHQVQLAGLDLVGHA